MSIQIIKQGLLDTIQDNGRYGYQHLGINPNGAMDIIAASVANMLVGNEPGEAVVEFHFPASSLFFEKACLIAISGADFTATVNDEIIPLQTAIIVSAQSTLSFKKHMWGARCYLAIQGGFDVNNWLNSYSTNTKIKAGGFAGRALQKNDVLHCRCEQFFLNDLPEKTFIITAVRVNAFSLYTKSEKIRCVQGKQFELLTGISKKDFLEKDFSITVQSDRMGYRLSGEILQMRKQQELLSSGITKGAIQLLPNGMLIVLMADHQTTGGYPVIAHVISADIPMLAQMQPNSKINFEIITIEEAQDIFIGQQQDLLQLQQQCNVQLQKFF